MASEHDPEHDTNEVVDNEIVQRLDEIDGTLLDHFENDARLQSGVPEGQRTSDLDFIQMSGLTRPQAQPAEPASADDLDPSKPLSFFERGVADVDVAMVPPDIVETHEPALTAPVRKPEAPTAAPAPAANDRQYLMTPSPDFLDVVDLEDAVEDIGSGVDEHDREAPVELRAPRAPDLEEAEQLLQALESQPRELPQATKSAPVSIPESGAVSASFAPTLPGTAPAAVPATPAFDAGPTVAMGAASPSPVGAAEPGYEYPLAVDMEPDAEGDSGEDGTQERDASVYNKPMPGKHTRRSHGGRPRSWRRIIRWAFRMALVLAVIAGVIAVSLKMRKSLEPPDQALVAAQLLKDQHKYREASDAFAAFAAGNREDARRAEAEFQAAYCLQQVQTATVDEQNEVRGKAFDLYKQFVTDNPTHEKTARAKTIMGLLLCDLRRFAEAVEILQDSELPLADPDGALPALRALAKARIEMNDFDGAASAYLQAAALSTNYAPDDDYAAMAVMYSLLSEKAADEGERKKYQRLAAERLTDAIRMPTIDPTRRMDLKTKRDYFLTQAGEQVPDAEEEGGSGSARTPEKAAAAAPPPPPPAEPKSPPDAKPQEVQQQDAKAPDPHLEAQYPGAK